MFTHPTVQFSGQRFGQSPAIALHHKINVLVILVQEKIAHKAAHGIDRQAQVPAQLSGQMQNTADFRRKAILNKFADIALLGSLLSPVRQEAAGFHRQKR